MTNGGKPFLNTDQQIEKLESRGLIIESKEDAKIQLIKTSYYDLVNGYKDMFLETRGKEEVEEEYIKGTTLNDLIQLYELDRIIRHSTLQITLDIECNLYSTLAYCIAERYGEKQEDYLKRTNYKRGSIQARNRKSERENLLIKINKKIEDPSEQPLIYYKQKYGNIPPWILVKDLTFGQLFMLYKLSKSEIKDKCIDRMFNIETNEHNKEFVVKSFEIFNKFRNAAAHGARMYNYKTRIELPYNEIAHGFFGITRERYNLGYGKNDYAAFMIALKYLYQKQVDFLVEYTLYLHVSLDEYKASNPLNHEKILSEMGIPEGYEEKMLT